MSKLLKYTKNQQLKHTTGTIYTVMGIMRGIYVIESLEGHTIRRTEAFLNKHFSTPNLKEQQKIPTRSPEARLAKDLDALKKNVTVEVDVEETDKRTLQSLVMEQELDDTVRLQFSKEIALPLRIFKEAVNSFALNRAGFTYITKKIEDKDDWSRLFLYCFINRVALKKFKKWNTISELAVSHIESKEKIEHLDYDKTSLPLKILVSKIESKTASLEDLHRVIVTLPNQSIKSELTYFCQCITGVIFDKKEFGSFKHSTKDLSTRYLDKL